MSENKFRSNTTDLTEADREYLRTTFAKEIDESRARMGLRNLFAVGCFLVRLGHDNAGAKAIASALECFPGTASLGNRIITKLKGREEAIAGAAWANAEFNCLFGVHERNLREGKENGGR